MDAIGSVDVRPALGSIRAPTLVIHRPGDATVPVEMGRLVAEGIPGARWVQLPGSDHLPWTGDVEGLVAEIERFVGEHALGSRTPAPVRQMSSSVASTRHRTA
jgi:pimeloyl-ACP methyl ester carboxylesterase